MARPCPHCSRRSAPPPHNRVAASLGPRLHLCRGRWGFAWDRLGPLFAAAALPRGRAVWAALGLSAGLLPGLLAASAALFCSAAPLCGRAVWARLAPLVGCAPRWPLPWVAVPLRCTAVRSCGLAAEVGCWPGSSTNFSSSCTASGPSHPSSKSYTPPRTSCSTQLLSLPGGLHGRLLLLPSQEQKFYRITKDGTVFRMHPAVGIYPDNFNEGRVQVWVSANGKLFFTCVQEGRLQMPLQGEEEAHAPLAKEALKDEATLEVSWLTGPATGLAEFEMCYGLHGARRAFVVNHDDDLI